MQGTEEGKWFAGRKKGTFREKKQNIRSAWRGQGRGKRITVWSREGAWVRRAETGEQ